MRLYVMKYDDAVFQDPIECDCVRINPAYLYVLKDHDVVKSFELASVYQFDIQDKDWKPKE